MQNTARLFTVLTVFIAMAKVGFPASALAQGAQPPIYNMPCMAGLPCVSPPPEVMFGSGYNAPGQILEPPTVRGPGYMAQSFAAIAFWQTEDGRHHYAYGSRRASSREEAEGYAKRECLGRGGQNCVVGLWGGNGHFAIARGRDGRYHAGFAGRLNQARRQALDSCKEASSGCRVVETVDSTPYYFEF